MLILLEFALVCGLDEGAFASPIFLASVIYFSAMLIKRCVFYVLLFVVLGGSVIELSVTDINKPEGSAVMSGLGAFYEPMSISCEVLLCETYLNRGLATSTLCQWRRILILGRSNRRAPGPDVSNKTPR
jgi:hypothetical protein